METQRLSTPEAPANNNQADLRDLGFGSVVARESRQRLLNRDGTFNVMRDGLGLLASLSLYHALLTMSWRKFFGLTALFYFGANLLFAAAYMLKLAETREPLEAARFANCVASFSVAGAGVEALPALEQVRERLARMATPGEGVRGA